MVFLKCSHCVVVGASVAVLPLLLSGWARSRSLHVVPTRACATLVCTQLNATQRNAIVLTKL